MRADAQAGQPPLDLSVAVETTAMARVRIGRVRQAIDPFASAPYRHRAPMTSQRLVLECRCGNVQGHVSNAFPGSFNRVVCYCDDCQAFLHAVGRADLLDVRGGTEIIQVPPAALTYTRGTEHIAGLRLSPTATTFRWHARCCGTALGNMGSLSVPAIGIVWEAFRDVRDPVRREAVLGPVQGTVFAKFAIGGVPPGARVFDFGLMLRASRRILGWKLRGRAWPHPFFDRGVAEPRYAVKTLTREQRDALRAKCGPSPSAATAP